MDLPNTLQGKDPIIDNQLPGERAIKATSTHRFEFAFASLLLI